MKSIHVLAILAALGVAGCGEEGPIGPAGPTGPPGEDGSNGVDGRDGNDGNPGLDGEDGEDGQNGMDGMDGRDGTDGQRGDPALDVTQPLSATVAMTLDRTVSPTLTFASYVPALVGNFDGGTLGGLEFPLRAAATDSVRSIIGVETQPIVSWLEPLTFDAGVGNPAYGANPNFLAFFGDFWDGGDGVANPDVESPFFRGASSAGWLYVGHEYISNVAPDLARAPSGQHLTFASVLAQEGVLPNDVFADMWAQEDVDTYIRSWKTQVGGSWLRIVQNPQTLEWEIDRLAANNLRFDATSDTQILVEGYALAAIDEDDDGNPLPDGVVSGTLANASGTVTPWGTIITAEGDQADFGYGELETCWDENQQFVMDAGCNSGAAIDFGADPDTDADFGRIGGSATPDVAGRHNRDAYGFLVEMDTAPNGAATLPGRGPAEYYGSVDTGRGHRKLGGLGRARWENASFHMDNSWRLVVDQPIVVYAANNRESGRVWRWSTDENFETGDTMEDVRAKLANGTLQVAHFANLDNGTGYTLDGTTDLPTVLSQGAGQWITMSVTSTDIAPNAASLGPDTTVGAALQDNSWNGIGGFADDNAVLSALFTAANKVGIRETNRPQDVAWDAVDGVLYIAFNGHESDPALNDDGVLAADVGDRDDTVGSIFALVEANAANPSAGNTFNYYVHVRGRTGASAFAFTNPSTLAIDGAGGLWFSTDGTFTGNNSSEAIYYADDRSGRVLSDITRRAFRVAAAPSDAEATGIAFTPNMRTMFFNVQHPGEQAFSDWPPVR